MVQWCTVSKQIQLVFGTQAFLGFATLLSGNWVNLKNEDSLLYTLSQTEEVREVLLHEPLIVAGAMNNQRTTVGGSSHSPSTYVYDAATARPTIARQVLSTTDRRPSLVYGLIALGVHNFVYNAMGEMQWRVARVPLLQLKLM